MCSFPDCDRAVDSKGLCNGHWQQQYKGKPLTPLREVAPAGTSSHYRTVHRYMEQLYGTPKTCEDCGTTNAASYEWAMKHGTSLSTERFNWKRLCVGCHRKYDQGLEHRLVCKRGHDVTNPSNVGYRRGRPYCKPCNRMKDRKTT